MNSRAVNMPVIWMVIGCCVLGLFATQQPFLILFVGGFVGFVIVSMVTPLVPLAVLMILSPLRSLIMTEAPNILPFDIGQLLFVVFIGTGLVRWLATRQNRLEFIPAPLLVGLGSFILATALSGVEAYSIGFWLSEWFKWVSVLVLVQFAVVFGQNRVTWLAQILVFAGAANALVGLYIFFGGSGADHLVVLERFFRAFGTFGQPNPFGGFMGLVLPLALALLIAELWIVWQSWQLKVFQYRHLSWVLVYSISTGLMGMALLASWSRGAWLGFVVSFIVVMFAIPKRLVYSIAVTGGIVVLSGSMWVVGLVPASISGRITEVADQYLAFSDVRGLDISTVNYAGVERIAHWQAAINMVGENPWLGVGFGNYEVAYPEYRLINWDEALGHAHNYYLNIFAEAGIIGFIAYLFLWAVIFSMTWRSRVLPDIRLRMIVIGLLGSWTYLSVHSLIDNLYVNNLFLHIGLLLGILSILYRQAREHIQWG